MLRLSELLLHPDLALRLIPPSSLLRMCIIQFPHSDYRLDVLVLVTLVGFQIG